MPLITANPFSLGQIFNPYIQAYLPHEESTFLQERIEIIEDVWNTRWKNTPQRYLDALLSERTIRIEGSLSETERIYSELSEVANHDNKLFRRVIACIVQQAKFLIIRPLSNEIASSRIENSLEKFSIYLQLSNNRILMVLQRADHRYEIGSLDVHSDLVHELGHIVVGPIAAKIEDFLGTFSDIAGELWTNKEEQLVINTIENRCLQERGKSIRISHRDICSSEKEYSLMTLADQIILSYKYGADATFEKLLEDFFKTGNPSCLLDRLNNNATSVWPETARKKTDEIFHNTLLKIKSQMHLEYEMNLKYPHLIHNPSPFARITRSLLYFSIRKDPCEAHTLRGYLIMHHSHHSVEDREASIRAFQAVKSSTATFSSRDLEIVLERRDYHWNDRCRQQTISKAIAWTIAEIENAPWSERTQKELGFYLQEEFPDIPATEKECLIQLISLSIHKGVIKFPRVSSCLPFRKTKPARIKSKKGWSIQDFLIGMKKK